MGSTAVHRKLGNVSPKLAIAFLVGSIGGGVVGGSINKALYSKDPLLSDTFISILYAGLLGFLGFYALTDFLKSIRSDAPVDIHGSNPSGATVIASRLQSLNIPPRIKFDEDYVPGGKRISAVIVALGGSVVGLLAALMGVGGGFVTFPMFVYVFGVSSMTTVGTDILQIIFTAGFAAISQYAIYGFVFYTLAIGMLLGSIVGIQLGALTTKVVKGIYIRGFYAVTILAGFVNRAAALPKKLTELEYINLSRSLINGIETTGNILFWVIVGLFGLRVLSMFLTSVKELRGEGEGLVSSITSQLEEEV